MSGTDASAHILIVDDDRLVLATLGQGLRDAGYRVSEASDAASALELARTKPDLALLDVRMPGTSGVQLAERFVAEYQLPFIFLSAFGDPRYHQARQRARRARLSRKASRRAANHSGDRSRSGAGDADQRAERQGRAVEPCAGERARDQHGGGYPHGAAPSRPRRGIRGAALVCPVATAACAGRRSSDRRRGRSAQQGRPRALANAVVILSGHIDCKCHNAPAPKRPSIVTARHSRDATSTSLRICDGAATGLPRPVPARQYTGPDPGPRSQRAVALAL